MKREVRGAVRSRSVSNSDDPIQRSKFANIAARWGLCLAWCEEYEIKRIEDAYMESRAVLTTDDEDYIENHDPPWPN
ncbi:hypothetical protein BSKO_05012 [Bryopsis sp. KO-2023]|nr:hypothetical protein BSKO_05012 [Bryopsis sp. KO-2023]